MPAEIAPIALDDSANAVAVFADAAKTKLTGATPAPPVTTDTVTQISITPVPMATFLITRS